jgi:hypothetical protein
LVIIDTFEISYGVLVFAALAATMIGVLFTAMHVKRRYYPHLIGALIGALLCFVLLESLPAIT